MINTFCNFESGIPCDVVRLIIERSNWTAATLGIPAMVDRATNSHTNVRSLRTPEHLGKIVGVELIPSHLIVSLTITVLKSLTLALK